MMLMKFIGWLSIWDILILATGLGFVIYLIVKKYKKNKTN